MEAYRYPTRRTGTFQDLLSIVARADERRHERLGSILPIKTGLSRFLAEAPFNLFGVLFSRVLEGLPADWALKAHDKVLAGMASPRHYPYDGASDSILRSRELIDRVKRETGQSPALLALISHPPVMGDMAHLNFELVRHATRALRDLRARACRPRLVVAVDPFALDTVTMPVEGLYAGVMGLYHLGLDRMSVGRGALSARLLGKTAWSRMVLRLLGLLRGGGEVGMVLSGGIPSTTRLLYAAREWLYYQRLESPLRSDPAEVGRRLRDEPIFEALSEQLGELKSVWRVMEARLMWALSLGGPEDLAAADTGRLTENAREAAFACLRVLGLPEERRARAVELLAEELARETPYRRRFFKLLSGRVLKKGRPVVLVPVVHHVEGGLRIEVKDAWAWASFSQGLIKAWRPGEAGRAWEGTPEQFAFRFVPENFA